MFLALKTVLKLLLAGCCVWLVLCLIASMAGFSLKLGV